MRDHEACWFLVADPIHHLGKGCIGDRLGPKLHLHAMRREDYGYEPCILQQVRYVIPLRQAKPQIVRKLRISRWHNVTVTIDQLPGHLSHPREQTGARILITQRGQLSNAVNGICMTGVQDSADQKTPEARMSQTPAHRQVSHDVEKHLQISRRPVIVF
jgi:hypothetical protein